MKKFVKIIKSKPAIITLMLMSPFFAYAETVDSSTIWSLMNTVASNLSNPKVLAFSLIALVGVGTFCYGCFALAMKSASSKRNWTEYSLGRALAIMAIGALLITPMTMTTMFSNSFGGGANVTDNAQQGTYNF